ncbi:MAG: NUDIX domain-containing protein [Lentisphaeria bacterium]|nr:NUDIX domain-containing protein [Lentisphaeria bacterium]NQZ66695.1 NUDIX domain-containing protein [Lentisphaeria bacterium]
MPRLAVRAVIIDGDEILLAKYKDERGYWYITPGGGVEEGETLEEAFHREMHEELGAEVPFGEMLFIREVIADKFTKGYLPEGFHQVEIAIRSSANGRRDFKPTEADTGQIGLEWVKLSDLRDILFFPEALKESYINQDWSKFYYGAVK